MSDTQWWGRLWLVRMLSLVFLLLAGCGGSDGTGGSTTAAGMSQLILHATTTDQQSAGLMPRAVTPGQTRQAEPITRLRVEVSGAGIPTPIVVECPIPGPVTPQCQVTETPNAFIVTIALLVPVGTERLVVVTGLDQTGAAILRGMDTVDLTQPSQSVTVMLAPVQANTPPRADAGPDQTVAVGTTVMLVGNGSSDTDGDPLTFAWVLLVRPPGSQATLSNPTSLNPTFVVDRPGAYIVQLTVNDGQVDSQPDVVTIDTVNSPPVANAGPNQSLVSAGQLVQLDGSGSSDANGDPLTFQWALTTRPAGSQATLTSATLVNPTFVADILGTYVAQLIVNDGTFDSLPATVTITPDRIPPVANAGPNQLLVSAGQLVQLDGSGSSDANGDPLTFQWTFVTRPPQSNATLANATLVNPTFVADILGTYVAQLIVNDGTFGSLPATVTITPDRIPPVANAGPNQLLVSAGQLVQLDGSGSSDANGDPLTFQWTFVTRPPQSNATLANATLVNPTFVADILGTYVAQLIVNDGTFGSLPATVTVQVPPPPPNRPPMPTAPSISTPQNMPGTSLVSPNDPDTSQTQTFSVSMPPAHGTASVTASGVATYTPASGFSGADSFAVTVTDNGTPPLSGAVIIPVTVQVPPNQPPAPTAPGISTPQNAPGTSTVSPNDPDVGQIQTFSVSTPPAHGTASVTTNGVATYTPVPGFSGADSFAVTVTDNGTPPLSGTVIIPVTVQVPPNQPPAPTAPGISTPQNAPGTSTVSPNDPDVGQIQTFSVSTPPAHGTASVTTNGVATYTPVPGFSGADSFAVTVTDNGTPPLSGTVTIPVTVQAPPNRAPAPTAPGISTPQNTPGTSTVSPNDPDVGQIQTFSVSTPPVHGTASVTTNGVATYTPAPGFSGADSFAVTVTDNGTPPLSGTVTIPVNVLPNRPPVLANPGAQSNAEGNNVGLQLNASDPDGNVLTFSASSLPLGLNINAATGLISGTIASGAATSVPLNVTVTVTDNGQPPLSASVSFPWNIAASIPVNTVRLVAPAGPVSPGTTFPATVQVNTGTTNVVSYFFDLLFDPRVVTVTNITQGSPLFEVPITNLGTSAVGSGTVKFAANNPTFAPANGVLTLATITFQVVGTPGLSSSLELRFPSDGSGFLVNDAFQAIGGITFVNDAVTVN